jgi:hypothetical protein
LTGTTASDATKQKMSATRSKKIWIKKEGYSSKHIHHSEYDYYNKLGWERGRTLGKQKKKRKSLSVPQKQALSAKLSLRVWIKKEGYSSKHIDAVFLETYTSNGWSKGRGFTGKGSRPIS